MAINGVAGGIDISASREAVWAVVIDPYNVGALQPGFTLLSVWGQSGEVGSGVTAYRRMLGMRVEVTMVIDQSAPPELLRARVNSADIVTVQTLRITERGNGARLEAHASYDSVPGLGLPIRLMVGRELRRWLKAVKREAEHPV